MLFLWYPVFLEFQTLLGLSDILPEFLWQSLNPFFAATIDTLDFKLYIAIYLVCLWLCMNFISLRKENRNTFAHPLFILLLLCYLISLTWTFLVFPHIISIPVYLAIPVFLLFFHGCYSFYIPREKTVDFLVSIGVIIGFIALFQYFGVSLGILEVTDDYRRNVAATLGHNTSTSFILYHTFLLIVFLKKDKIKLYLPLLLILIFGIIVAQSRSTYLQISINGLIVLYIFRKNIRSIIKTRYFKAGILILLFIVLSQSFPNPLLLSRKSLGRRLYDFSPSILMRGTRMRIARISLDMIKDRPFAGSGINSFRYYYPYYQGEYFKTHEHTFLVPSDRKTDRAHNDILQLVIESGVIIAAVLLVLYCILLMKLFRKKMLLEALFLLNFLVQSLVDFPFRLPFLAAYILFFIALAWSKAFQPYDNTVKVKKNVLYLFVASFGLIFMLILPYYYNMFYFSQAQRYIRLIRTPDILSPSQRNIMLERAEIYMDKALNYNFYDVDSRYYAGVIQLQKGDKATAQHHFDLALAEGSNHFLHYYLGLINYYQGNLEKAQLHLSQCVFKSPNFTPGLYLQLRVLSLLEKKDPLFLRYYQQYTQEEGYDRLMRYAFELIEESNTQVLPVLFHMGTHIYPHDTSMYLMKYTSYLSTEKKRAALSPAARRVIDEYAREIREKKTISHEEQLFLWFLDEEYERIRSVLIEEKGYYQRFILALIE